MKLHRKINDNVWVTYNEDEIPSISDLVRYVLYLGVFVCSCAVISYIFDF